jgi:hypothetical protein
MERDFIPQYSHSRQDLTNKTISGIDGQEGFPVNEPDCSLQPVLYKKDG